MATKSISELNTAPDVVTTDLFEIAQADQSSQSGYKSYKQTLSSIADAICKDIDQNTLETTSKKIVGAINEIRNSGGASTLAGLADTDISSVTDGQVLKYNGTTQKWENGSGGGGASSLADLTDTAISSPSNKQGLIYNGTSNKWENQDIEGLPDNTITYAQFIQMSDAEQLAFTGNVTDYPGIDDMPNADDIIYDNTDSGLTANNVQDAIDEVESRVTELEKEHIHEFNITSVAITSLWGSMYVSSEQSISLSSLGLSEAPKVISLIYIGQIGGIAIPVYSSVTKDYLKIILTRGTSATVTGKIVAVLRY